ncbi:MAG: hypothetical protein U0354_15875 [Candidatus Sericytochromatia bacterium]
MKKKVILLIVIFLISCTEEKEIEVKHITSIIKNIEIKSINKIDFDYYIKISNGFQVKNIIKSKDISFVITKNNQKFIGTAEKFEYNQDKKMLIFNNLSVKKNDLNFKSNLLEFTEDKGINKTSEIIIKSNNFYIEGFNLNSNKKLNNFTLNKIKSRFKF